MTASEFLALADYHLRRARECRLFHDEVGALYHDRRAEEYRRMAEGGSK